MSNAAKAGAELKDPSTVGEIAPAEAIDGMDKMSVAHVGGTQYRVLSWRSGETKAYNVDIDALTCDCEDMEYNQDGSGVCPHLAYALYMAPRQHSVEDNALWEIVGMVSQLMDALNYPSEPPATPATEAMSNGTTTEAATETNDAPTLEETKPAPSVDPEAAAEKLQAAYDAVVDDMQVTTTDRYVWIQTGRDTPDTIPGPGNVSVFDAFLKNPDHVEYIFDDHDAAHTKPGEWWRNRINPVAVDSYIEEVLE